MTTHTEGEWINCDLHEKFTNVKRVIKTKEGIILAYVVYEDERVPGISERGEDIININMANARLMCAAPKLLKFAERVNDFFTIKGGDTWYAEKYYGKSTNAPVCEEIELFCKLVKEVIAEAEGEL